MVKKIVNYQTEWKRERVKVKDLILDIENARLDIEDETQDAIINDLFINEKAMVILTNIRQNGFYADEPPVVVKENGKFIVLDGNRRVVSLKAMINPGIAPHIYTTRIEKLMAGDQPIEYIDVHVATTRNEAMEYLAAKHTKNTWRPWSALRRAYFYYAQKEKGQSIEKLIERYKGVDIPKYIKMYEMHLIALSLNNISPDIRKKIANKREFQISNLERFYSDIKVQEKLGIDFDKVTGEAQVPSGTDFDKVYSKVVSDIVSGIATSRKQLSKEDDRKKYLDSIVTEILGKDKIGQSKKKAAASFKPSKKVSRKKKEPLISNKFECPFDSAGVGYVMWELKTMDYEKFPNAAAGLLRTFLEISLKKYLKETGRLPPPKRKNGYIFLKDVLTKMKTDLQGDSNHTLVQVIMEIENNKSYLESINHNPEVFAVGYRVKETWDQIQPLIEYVFDDYKKLTESDK